MNSVGKFSFIDHPRPADTPSSNEEGIKGWWRRVWGGGF